MANTVIAFVREYEHGRVLAHAIKNEETGLYYVRAFRSKERADKAAEALRLGSGTKGEIDRLAYWRDDMTKIYIRP